MNGFVKNNLKIALELEATGSILGYLEVLLAEIVCVVKERMR